MNAKIEQRHRQRLADLMNAEAGSTWKYVADDFLGYQLRGTRVALQQIANADAAARAFRYGGSVAPHMAALICPDDTGGNKVTPEPKETEK